MRSHVAPFFIVVSGLIGCPNPRPVSPTPPVIDDSDVCVQACQHLNDLGCEEGRPVASGVECVSDSDCREGDDCVDRVCHAPCATFCRETQDWGIWLQPRCVAEINLCGDIDRCQ